MFPRCDTCGRISRLNPCSHCIQRANDWGVWGIPHPLMPVDRPIKARWMAWNKYIAVTGKRTRTEEDARAYIVILAADVNAGPWWTFEATRLADRDEHER